MLSWAAVVALLVSVLRNKLLIPIAALDLKGLYWAGLVSAPTHLLPVLGIPLDQVATASDMVGGASDAKSFFHHAPTSQRGIPLLGRTHRVRRRKWQRSHGGRRAGRMIESAASLAPTSVEDLWSKLSASQPLDRGKWGTSESSLRPTTAF